MHHINREENAVADITTRFRAFQGGILARRADRLNAIMSDMTDIHWADHLAEALDYATPLDTFSKVMESAARLFDTRQPGQAIPLDYNSLHLWTVAHFGCPATDLVRLFSASLSGQDRRAHWEELLEDYYGYVKEEIGSRKMAYSLEQ
ncbi:hypothetical protein OSTOST_14015, partial [Ostertagia ostertagi]